MSRVPLLAFHRLLRASLFLLALLAAGAAPALATGTFTRLGTPLTSRTFQASTFTQAPDGRDLLCTVVRAQPVAKLLVIDVATGRAWAATTASDHSVYIGTEPNGKLFRFVPGESQVHDLGRALAGETHVWDLAAGRDGEVFGGTYPHCRVFRYAPASGFSEPAPGPIVAGETYARSVAFATATGTLYVGAGVKTPHLLELDLATGSRRELPLPPRYAREQSVYQLFVAGDFLLAMIYPVQRTLVFERRSRRLVAELDTSGHYDFVSPPSPHDGRIYFLHAGNLRAFDPARPSLASELIGPVPSSQAMAWLADPGDPRATSLVIFAQGGKLIRHHPPTGRFDTLEIDAPEEPTLLHSLATGPGGRIWTSGYLFGGAAVFDPETRRSEQFKGISQAEAIAALDDTIYFGLYPRARLQEFDTRRPWIERGDNPREFAILPRQSRPMTMLAVPELDSVFVGTVPEYGRLGGMLAVWNARGRTLESFPDVVARQSIASLAFADGLIVGGSTVQGGLGVEPVETEARLFLWDPKSKTKIFETPPVAGARIVSGLTAMPDRTVWGFAEGAFFIFDLASRRVTHIAPALPSDFTGRALWQDANLVVHPDGNVFAIQHDRLLRIDRRTREITVLREGLHNKHGRPIAIDRHGRIYFADGVELWRYEP